MLDGPVEQHPLTQAHPVKFAGDGVGPVIPALQGNAIDSVQKGPVKALIGGQGRRDGAIGTAGIGRAAVKAWRYHHCSRKSNTLLFSKINTKF
jgi:hypothetical protein